jgi:hypothetical protein
LRKLMIGAVAASATLALAAGAVAQDDPGVQFVAKATPKNAGTKSKPTYTKLNFNMKVDLPGTTVQYIDLTLPRGLKLNGKGLGSGCTEESLYPDPSTGPCAKSKAGPAGKATAVLAPNNTPLEFRVEPYVKNRNTLLFRIVAESGTAIDTPLTGKITNRGRKLSIEIPEVLRCPSCPAQSKPPAPPVTEGNDASLTGLNQSFYAKKGRKYLVSSVGCKGGKHTFTGTLRFSQRRDALRRGDTSVPPPSTSKASSSCTK